jgi:AcrR family transcriptional regulator
MMVRSRTPEKRENILKSALKLFVANGVQNTTTAEIANEAGIAAGTLFLYFKTKNELINELVLKIVNDQSDSITSLLDPSFSAQETFLAIWNGTIRWFLEDLDVYQYIQQIRDSGMVAEAVVEESGKYLSYYFVAIQKGLKEGSIKPYPMELVGDFLYHDIVAVMNLIKTQPDQAKREDFIRQGFEIFWNGIKSTPDANPYKE